MDPDTKHRNLLTLRKPILDSAIRALKFSPGSRGLDVGCGIGSQTLALANAVQPGGHVTGLDISPTAIAFARESAEDSELAHYVCFQEGDMHDLPFERDSFDWVWSMDCVGYAPLEPLPLIRELIRVVKPGGIIAILAWSSQQFLPGYPSLEARISGTTSGIAPFVEGKSPHKHFSRALGWFRDAGREAPMALTFAGSVHAPLIDKVRSELLALFQMRWPAVQSELNPEDWAVFQRLCEPGSPDFILDEPDYYGFFTYSLMRGMVPDTHAGLSS